MTWFAARVNKERGELDAAIAGYRALVETRFPEARRRGFDFARDTRLLNELGQTLRERAQRAWDEHPDRTGEEDDRSPAFGMMGRQDLMDEILATEIIEFPLWASMYSEEGRRLLELMPMVRPFANFSAFFLLVVDRHLMCTG